MIQVVNVGNTHTQIGICDGGGFRLLPPLASAELEPADLVPGIPAVAASVVPAVRARLEKAGVRFPELTEFAGSVDFRQIDRSTLGMDRAANAIALARLYPLPGIVADCGTAITLELVDEHRVFRGGAIAPGRMLMRRALRAGTAQLPEIPLAPAAPERPGGNTAEAIRFGVDCGAIGLVKTLIETAARSFRCAPTVVLTGGDAPFFRAALPEATCAPEDFTLRGIRFWAFPEE